jgi:hypothetical protein
LKAHDLIVQQRAQKFLGQSENRQSQTFSVHMGDNWHPNFPPNQNILEAKPF